MRRLRNLLAGVAAATTLFAGAAYAEPTLQLDILDGVYDTNTETIVATSDQFTLYALLLPDQDTLLGDTFYISAALVPQTSTSTDLGSFTFNGTTIDVTADMVYGVPPLEANLAFDANDLSKHGIFPTYFAEFEFTFDPNNTATAYNTQDDAGEGPTPDPNGTMYFEDFLVDVSNLDGDYTIHFDLYTKDGVEGDIDRDEFAPFSHDAESGPRQVPEPSTLLLLGTAASIIIASRKKNKG
ncbi:MAG TPA: hypothetical protein DDW94_00825 [Deltaproteobacteria bacterium]|nr:MAG: hypothetical protein A2Z79_06190 [Deltaproteobacteria bacterium GWA2_55_82]OIJ73226.1 MAG: hypothetical protein A2V21_302470 [Deltaproteobacteria bacterium GWC2_55_46]HBG45513.1 hypothetical protein [Deltaproteobacteria bacterium]HCY10344.1 hypothetical protein [Deltaproteobacteria bacterium]